MKQPFYIMDHEGIRYLIVGNEAFDWGVDESEVKEVTIKSKNDPALRESFLGSIEKHFVNCFSQFIGRPVTIKDINDALDVGWIESTAN